MPKKRKRKNPSGKQGGVGAKGGNQIRGIREKLRQLKKFPRKK